MVFVGKLAYFKGVDVLIRAAQDYHEHLNQSVHTLIIGDGELAEELESMVASLNLNNIHFLGHQSQEKLRGLYSVADLSVVPSRREPFGLVAIEALACGTPVVATAEGGLAEIINEDVGTLVPVDDPLALSGAICQELLREDRSNRKLKASCYAYENYSQEKIIGEMISVYEKIIEEN